MFFTTVIIIISFFDKSINFKEKNELARIFENFWMELVDEDFK